MKFYIIIPAHNEEEYIGSTLDSLATQTVKPEKLVVVNDNSTDKTEEIVNGYVEEYKFISIINKVSSDKHIPGSKIINAFNKGLESIDDKYDVICKFDADLIFPLNYLENIAQQFRADPKTGMVGGFCYVEENRKWVLEGLTNKDHIRGALKAYKKECFQAIGGLRNAMGWDTADELLAQYYGWNVITVESLHVKHLKPTGHRYTKNIKNAHAEALYRIRFGMMLTFLYALKTTFKRRNLSILFEIIKGYWIAKSNPDINYIVNEEEGRFIRQHRWKNIRNRLF